MEIYIKLWQNAKRNEADQEHDSRIDSAQQVIGHHAPGSGELFEAVDAERL